MTSQWNDEEDLTIIEDRRSQAPETAPTVELPPPPLPSAQSHFPFQPALPRDRFTAFLIDLVLLAYLLFGLHQVMTHSFFSSPGFEGLRNFQKPLLYLTCALGFFLYFVIFEAIGGATPGKFLCRLRVVDQEGKSPRLNNIFLRNLCRAFDNIPPFLISVLSMESSPLHQSLGDRAASTVVVKKTRKRLTPIDLKTAPLSSTLIRILSCILDLALYFTFLWLYGTCLNPDQETLFKALLLALPFFAAFYFFLFEFFTSTTPGKLLFGRACVLENGEPLDGTSSFLRNLTRPLDLLLGYPLLALTRRKQRLGDLISDSLVIKHPRAKKEIISLVSLILVLAGLAYLGSQNPNKTWFRSQLQTLLKTRPEIFARVKPPPSKPVTPAVLQITEFYFASKPSRDAVRPDGVFRHGDQIFVFLKLKGFRVDADRRVSVSQDFEILAPNGSTLAAKQDVALYSDILPAGSEQMISGTPLLLSPSLPSGSYTLRITLHDHLAQEKWVEDRVFSLR